MIVIEEMSLLRGTQPAALIRDYRRECCKFIACEFRFCYWKFLQVEYKTAFLGGTKMSKVDVRKGAAGC